MIADHLPALQIAVPLVAAPLCVIIGRGRIAQYLSLLACAAAFIASIRILGMVLTDGPISYALGGWAAPWGIEYRIDVLNGFVLVLVAAIGFFVQLFSPRSIADEIDESKHYLFYAAFLLCLTGLLGIVITGDAFNVFVFLEVAALSSYVLIALGRDRRALAAAYQYLVMGTIGSTFILIGIGFLYMMTGTLNMADIAARLGPVSTTRTVLAAFAFITVGVSIKMALFPLHLWLPNAYTYAPSVVTAFLAATATKASVYVLIRFMFTIFGEHFVFKEAPVTALLLPAAVFAVVFASATALFQSNVKRMLAYSSVAQIGYMVLGISFLTVNGLTGGIVHLFNHALMKGGLFLAVGCVVFRVGSANLDDFAGMGKRMPVTMFLFVLGGLSLIGVPLTVGFISKWYLVLAAVESGSWWIAGVILAGSLLAVAYVWRVVETAYFREPKEGAIAIREAPLSMLIPTATLVAASLFFGVNTGATAGVARRAAEFLLGVGP